MGFSSLFLKVKSDFYFNGMHTTAMEYPRLLQFPGPQPQMKGNATPQPSNLPSCWSTAASRCTESELLIRFLSLSYH